MLCQPDLHFSERPVFVAHQAQERQQLWLREDVFGELTPIRWHHRLRNGAADQGETHQSDFGHVATLLPPSWASQQVEKQV